MRWFKGIKTQRNSYPHSNSPIYQTDNNLINSIQLTNQNKKSRINPASRSCMMVEIEAY